MLKFHFNFILNEFFYKHQAKMIKHQLNYALHCLLRLLIEIEIL